MKIALIISNNLATSAFDGVRIQAETWAEGLEKLGHNVIKLNPWEKQEWKSYDYVHIIGTSWDLEILINGIVGRWGCKIAFSPIIDTNTPKWIFKLMSHWGSKKIRLESIHNRIRNISPKISLWCARSEYEAEYIHQCYSIPRNKISVIPLSYRIPEISYFPQKENFCLHVSHMGGNKNVDRLIEAAIKYDFNLVLAGKIGNEKVLTRIKDYDSRYKNIRYLGAISDEDLYGLYKRAKVFALPSLYEGVGMVALEAASYGCEIVITNLGGPKEYYNNMAFVINPKSFDDIGTSVIKAMDGKYQPTLQKYIKNNYSLSKCMSRLVEAYEKH